MREIIGSTNRILEVNLTSRDVREFLISSEERRLFLGGKGLGLYYLYQRLRPGTDPLGPENVLIFMMGLILGSGATCSARFEGVSKSPLTGLMVASSCGGPFGMAFKTAGYEGLIITGKAAAPTVLEIGADGVSFRDAGDLWGLDTRAVQARLLKETKSGALAIGPAGENQVLYANIASGERFLGRGGMGAVMGSKNLKAVVAVGGAVKIVPADRHEFSAVHKKATCQINRNFLTGKAYRTYGTPSHVNYCNKSGILPVENFSSGKSEKADLVSGERMRDLYQTRPSACRPCTILCGHKGTYPDGQRQVPEYETVGLFGPNLGIFDPLLISDWNEICGKLGMDTISAAGTLAYLMEAGKKGLVNTSLRFGSPEGICQTLEDIACRRGAGDEYANGSRWLSEKYGGSEFAIQVKGMEMAAYDPRGAFGQGLAYAVANRGADHLSATLFPMEAFLGFLNPAATRSKANFVRFFEDLYAAVNSMQTCLFSTLAYVLEAPIVKLVSKPLLAFVMQFLPEVAIALIDVSVFTRMISSMLGYRVSKKQLLQLGSRIHVLERYMNVREGVSRKEDTLPARFLTEGRRCDPQQRVVPLDEMLDDYYRLRGFNQNGIPLRQTLLKLGIPLDAAPDRREHPVKGTPVVEPSAAAPALVPDDRA